MSRLVLIRGLPGSGKSTMARTLALVGFHHYEADMFHIKDGEYKFDHTKIDQAHKWCQDETRKALAAGEWVVVSNTFTQLWEMQPYRRMADELGAALTVIEADGKWQNVHNVPQEALDRMRARWEPLHKVNEAAA